MMDLSTSLALLGVAKTARTVSVYCNTEIIIFVVSFGRIGGGVVLKWPERSELAQVMT